MLLGGCEFLGLSDTASDPTTPPPNPVENTAPPVAEVTPVAKRDGAEYQRPDYPNMSRRNPFQPDLEVVKPASVADEGQEERLGPLERFTLGELELVAIISEVAVPKAMFIDPEGFGHVLKEGDRIGRNSGVLSDIRDNEVEVTETTGEDEGQTRLRTVKLRDADLSVGNDSALTDEERAALEKLLETEEGRKALEERYRKMALGASAAGDDAPQAESRFQGSSPPAGQ
jgi:Tfp pilus assembly protein PilP